MAKTDKVATVAEITERFRSASAAVVTEYRGLTMAQLTALRRSLGKDTAYTVAKNTLVKRAAADAGVEGLDDLFVGPTAVAFISGEPVDAAKALRDFAKTHPLLVIKGGLLDGRPIEPGEVNKLADLESREVLLGKLAGAMLGTLTKAAYVLNALPSQVARLAAALQDKRVADGETLEVAAEAAVVEAAVEEVAAEAMVLEAVEEAAVEEVAEEVAAEAMVLEAAEEAVVEAVAEDAAVLEAAVVQAVVEEVTTIEAVAEETLEAEAVSGDSPADEAAVVEEVVEEAAAEEAEVIEAAAEEIAVIETAADEIADEIADEVADEVADEIADEIADEAVVDVPADATDSFAGDRTDKDAAPEA
jgi:large subunit ribosomal protein L10